MDNYDARRRRFMAAAGAAMLAARARADGARLDLSLDPLTRAATPRGDARDAVLTCVTRAGARLVAAGEAGIVIVSDDDGLTWSQAQVPVSVTLTALAFATPDRGWAVGHDGVVLHSEDGGSSWRRQLDGGQVADGPDRPLLDVHAFDAHTAIAVGAYGMALMTQDGGRHWASIMTRIDNPDERHWYRIIPAGCGSDDSLWLVGEQGRIVRSDNARGEEPFKAVASPYAGSFFDAVAHETGLLALLGLRGHGFMTRDDGQSWQPLALPGMGSLHAGLWLPDGRLLVADEAGRLSIGTPVQADAKRVMTFRPLRMPRSCPVAGLAQAADGALVVVGACGVARLDAARLEIGEQR